MRIRPFVLAVLLLLATGSVAWAGKEAYTLAMSKDKVLCKSLLNLFNEDVNKHGELTYQSEAFIRVQWQTVENVEDEQNPTYGCSILKRAIFDIDNDGRNNLVLKHSGCLHDLMSDGLFVFPEGSDILSRLKPGPSGLSDMFSSVNKFDRSGHDYELKAIPTKRGEPYPSIITIFVLQPFLWRNTSYISVTGSGRDWVVIAKYRHAENIEDICYFKPRL